MAAIINSALKNPASTLDQTATQPGVNAPQAQVAASTVPTPSPTTAPTTGIINSAANPTTAPTSAPTAAPTPAPTAAPVDYTSQLQDLYHQDLNRAGDTAGLDFFNQQLASGKTDLAGVDAAIHNSDEYKALHATPAPTMAPVPTVPGYTAAQLGTPTAWNVTPDQTTAGQLKTLLDSNSPIIQQARTQGLELANDRGLLNSSIGESAALDSAYRTAVPIAQSDAATQARAAGYNADESNQFQEFNTSAQNQANQANLSAAVQQSIARLQAQTQTNLSYLDHQTQINLANLSSDNQVKLASIEANYHNVMQANASAANLFAQITQNITNISASKDMDAAAKQAAVDNQIKLLQNGLGINGALSNLNLGSLLDFSGMNTIGATPANTQMPVA